MLKMTTVRLALMQDRDMHVIIEKASEEACVAFRLNTPLQIIYHQVIRMMHPNQIRLQ